MKSYKILAMFIALFITASSFMACKKSSFDDTPGQVSLYQIITDDTQFSMIRYAVNRAGMQDLLKGDGSTITLIAPTNQAFLDMGFGINGHATLPTLEKMTNEDLAKLVKNHLISGRVELSTITGSNEITTMGRKIKVTKTDQDYYINGADVTHLGVNATNGYMFVINKPVLPESNLILRENLMETLKARTNFTYLVAAINKASTSGTNYVELLSGQTAYTLLAPENTAFTRAGYASVAAVTAAPAADLSALLSRHMLAGTRFTSDMDSLPVNTLSGAAAYFDRDKVRTGDFVYTLSYANGVTFNTRGAGANNLHANGSIYHMVSQVLPAPVAVSTLSYIQADPALSFFAAAINEASTKTGTTVDFTALLSASAPSHTVYAPTNDAFIAAGYLTEADVRTTSIGVLTNLVSYHLIKYRRAMWSNTDGNSVSTLLRLTDASANLVAVPVTVNTSGGYSVRGKNNTATIPVVTADVVTTNGLVNKINTLLRGE